jgi:broad specificity phosphatase PhoE
LREIGLFNPGTVLTRLFLLRHGRAALPDGRRRFIGRTDPPLAPEGVEEATAAGRAIVKLPFDRMVSSDLQRARRTAEEVARFVKLPVRLNPCLREIDLGGWEGLEVEAVKRDHPEAYEARGLDFEGFRPPGGESFGDLSNRALPFLLELATFPGNVLVVGHSGVFRVFMASVLGISIRQAFLLRQDTGSFHVLSGRAGKLAVERLNWKSAF